MTDEDKKGTGKMIVKDGVIQSLTIDVDGRSFMTNEATNNYMMMVKIPINKVPPNVSLQEAKVTAEVWLKSMVPDAELVNFYEVF